MILSTNHLLYTHYTKWSRFGHHGFSIAATGEMTRLTKMVLYSQRIAHPTANQTIYKMSGLLSWQHGLQAHKKIVFF